MFMYCWAYKNLLEGGVLAGRHHFGGGSAKLWQKADKGREGGQKRPKSCRRHLWMPPNRLLTPLACYYEIELLAWWTIKANTNLPGSDTSNKHETNQLSHENFLKWYNSLELVQVVFFYSECILLPFLFKLDILLSDN